MKPQVEVLAQQYFEGEPAEISDAAIALFCDWIMAEFQQLPLAVQVSNSDRYGTIEEMFLDIDQGHLWASMENYDSDIYPTPFFGVALLSVHDYDHYLRQADFSLEGEMTAYREIAERAPSLEIQKMLYSEIVLKAAAYICLGHKPESKVVFP